MVRIYTILRVNLVEFAEKLFVGARERETERERERERLRGWWWGE